MELFRIVRSDFYFNVFVGLLFNSKFYSLVTTYYFFSRMGFSMYLNTKFVSSLGAALGGATHRNFFSTQLLLRLVASFILVLLLFV